MVAGKYPKSLRMLDSQSVETLAAILRMPADQLSDTGMPSEEWLAAQKDLIAGALSNGVFLRGNGLKALQIKLENKSLVIPNRLGLGPPPTSLCEAHKGLNPLLIRSVFNYLTREIVEHADRIRTCRKSAHHTPAVDSWSDRTLGVAALWLDPAIFKMVAGSRFPSHLKFPYMHKACEACIIAAIGSRGGVLADISAGYLSRWELDCHQAEKKERRNAKRAGRSERVVRVHKPHIKSLIEAWVNLQDEDEAAAIRLQSDHLIPVLFKVRRHIGWSRHRKRARYLEKLGDGEGLSRAEFLAAKMRDPDPDPVPSLTRHGHPIPQERRHSRDQRGGRGKTRRNTGDGGSSVVDSRSSVSSQVDDDVKQHASSDWKARIFNNPGVLAN